MATFDLGRVTPIYKGDYSASASYELNDVVLYNGNLYWHVQPTATVGVLPTNTTIWKAAFDGNGIRAEIRGYADDAQASANSAQESRTAVAQSASQASESATQASTYAANASASATEASSSATNAEASATQAQEYAEQAEESAEHFVLDTKLIKDSTNGVENQAIYPLLGAFPTDTAQGAIASFTDGADEVPLKSLTVGIDPVQSGTGDPSPSNVRPISGWTGANVVRTGVNVWDEEWEVGTISSTTGKTVSDPGRIRSKNYILCVPSSAYCFAKTNVSDNTDVRPFFYDASKNFISVGAWSSDNIVQNTPSNCHYMKFICATGYGTTYNHDISINYPSTDHDYHPYSGQSINIQLGQTVYGGTLDVVSGVLTVDYEHLLFDGSETWNLQSINSHGIANFAMTASIPSYAKPIDLICNRLPLQTSVIAETTTEGIMPAGNTNIYIRLNSSMASTVAELKQWLTSNNVEVVYKIRTPLTIQLTPHEVTALLGSNNVWADSGDSEVVYRADPTLYIQRLTEPDADMVADANITNGSYFMVGNTLYKATANIASGATISPNVNCTRKSLSEALNELNA